MQRIWKASTLITMASFLLAVPSHVLAATSAVPVGINCATISSESNGSVNPGCNAQLSDIISKSVTILFIAAVLLALTFLIIGGVRWILSGGDKEGTAKARGMITAAIIGLAIVFLSFIIMTVLGNIFGFSLTDLTIPSIGGT